MAEWLYEEGIGENRAVVVADGEIIEAAIETPGGLRAGTVVEGRLRAILVPGRRGVAETAVGEVLIEPLGAALTEGHKFRIEIVREAVPERGRPKLPKGRSTDDAVREGPTLAQRISPARLIRHTDPDAFETAGWSELLEQAASGEIAFDGGALRMSLTPAMTLFDVDGGLPPAELAVAGAAAAGRAIRRFDLGGSIGIDLPTVPDRAARQAAAAALDAALPPPFERTAVNGFGFLQIVRRRERLSIPELLAADPAGGAARALLRRAEREPGAGPLELRAHPAVTAELEAHPRWAAELSRRAGAEVRLRADPALAISAGHVHRIQSG